MKLNIFKQYHEILSYTTFVLYIVRKFKISIRYCIACAFTVSKLTSELQNYSYEALEAGTMTRH